MFRDTHEPLPASRIPQSPLRESIGDQQGIEASAPHGTISSADATTASATSEPPTSSENRVFADTSSVQSRTAMLRGIAVFRIIRPFIPNELLANEFLIY